MNKVNKAKNTLEFSKPKIAELKINPNPKPKYFIVENFLIKKIGNK